MIFSCSLCQIIGHSNVVPWNKSPSRISILVVDWDELSTHQQATVVLFWCSIDLSLLSETQPWSAALEGSTHVVESCSAWWITHRAERKAFTPGETWSALGDGVLFNGWGFFKAPQSLCECSWLPRWGFICMPGFCLWQYANTSVLHLQIMTRSGVNF